MAQLLAYVGSCFVHRVLCLSLENIFIIKLLPLRHFDAVITVSQWPRCLKFLIFNVELQSIAFNFVASKDRH